MQDYKSSHTTVMICAILVNTRTHRYTDSLWPVILLAQPADKKQYKKSLSVPSPQPHSSKHRAFIKSLKSPIKRQRVPQPRNGNSERPICRIFALIQIWINSRHIGSDCEMFHVVLNLYLIRRMFSTLVSTLTG